MTQPLPTRPGSVDSDHERSDRTRSLLTIGFTMTAIVSTLAFVSVFSVGFAMVFGLISGFVGLHYVLWGWWLGSAIQEDEPFDGER